MMNSEPKNESYKDENPYLLKGFWEFAIIATLMVAFFPWSLLYCLIVHGMTETKYIVLALFHDALKTFFGILSLLFVLVGGILLLILFVGFLAVLVG
jgi:hypothetical protein